MSDPLEPAPSAGDPDAVVTPDAAALDPVAADAAEVRADAAQVTADAAEVTAAAVFADPLLPSGADVSDGPPTTEQLAAMAAAVEAARPTSTGLPWLDAAPEPIAPTEPVAAPRRARLRFGVKRALIRLGSFALTMALLVGGVAIGMSAFQRSVPPPPAVGDLSTSDIATPAVVQELAEALATNDATSLRSAVPQEPYGLLTSEMQSWGMAGVTSVETLATMQDGNRSATEIVINGRNASGDPLVFNLVVHVADNQIVGFR